MDQRIEIIREMRDAGLISDVDDFCNVQHALEAGKSRDFILYEMPELERWHKAFAFLLDRL